MRLTNFIEGLTILQRYYDKPDGFHIGAEHDIVYLFKTDRPLTEADLARMVELDWIQPENNFEDVSDYDPQEPWSAFT